MFFLIFTCAFDDALNPGRHFSPHIGTNRKPGVITRRFPRNTFIRILWLLFSTARRIFSIFSAAAAVAFESVHSVFALILYRLPSGRTNLITITRRQHRSRHFFLSRQIYVARGPDCIVLCQPMTTQPPEHASYSTPPSVRQVRARWRLLSGLA